MATPATKAFLATIRKPQGGFLDVFILLMPLLEDLFASLLENCASTEQRAVDLIASPRDFQVVRAERKAHRKFRREPEFTSLNRRERNQLVNEMLMDVVDAANENPQLVAAAWRSTRQAS